MTTFLYWLKSIRKDDKSSRLGYAREGCDNIASFSVFVTLLVPAPSPSGRHTSIRPARGPCILGLACHIGSKAPYRSRGERDAAERDGAIRELTARDRRRASFTKNTSNEESSSQNPTPLRFCFSVQCSYIAAHAHPQTKCDNDIGCTSVGVNAFSHDLP
ncbi:hypothetical protein EVAR_29421_1 [Eumeta japonica]|uniref:Uncharacterized protein n=1 Tax=Eumeta variegata TaxID=151549 RepID=A0A4C1VSE4_EUMVA|nr:hypothetical protein EVAR_29421_1 [Eumeta japonica]